VKVFKKKNAQKRDDSGENSFYLILPEATSAFFSFFWRKLLTKKSLWFMFRVMSQKQ
jgi:hypothetical protein